MKISRHEGIDETIAWLGAEWQRLCAESKGQETEALKHIGHAHSALKALDVVLDRAEVFANQNVRRLNTLRAWAVSSAKFSSYARDVLRILDDKAH